MDYNKTNKIFENKKISIMGDSISTLEGYNPKGYNVYYSKDFSLTSGIKCPQDTWWGKVIERLGGELLVNNSWSGSWVAKLPDREELFFSACSDERTSGLHIGDVKPDVIIIYMGTNDWAFGASPECKCDIQILKDQSFKYAYNNMLTKLKKNYPDAQIWCCTLGISDLKKFPFKCGGTHIQVYCDIIREVSKENGCKVIDIYSSSVPYNAIDGFHPSPRGMETLAQIITKEIIKHK